MTPGSTMEARGDRRARTGMATRLPSLGPSLGAVHRGRAVMKRLLPRSLLGRSLLMILLPLLILEGVALEVFYGSHINVVSRRLAGCLVFAAELGDSLSALQPGYFYCRGR